MPLTNPQKSTLWLTLISLPSGGEYTIPDEAHLEAIKTIADKRLLWDQGEKDVSLSEDYKRVRVIF